MKIDSIKSVLAECLADLSDDMDCPIVDLKANYITERVFKFLKEDYEAGKFGDTDYVNTIPKLISKIKKTFKSISVGDIECRSLNVVNVMKCLRNKDFGIYPPVIAR